MADNVTLNSMTGGSVVAADDIGSVYFQRFKLTIGADGVNDGDVSSANPLPVSLPNEGQQTMTNSISVAIASDQSSLPVVLQTGANAIGKLNETSASTIKAAVDKIMGSDERTAQDLTLNFVTELHDKVAQRLPGCF